jgi:FtsP/CotA-like multicopper oxidase with cupredoxin domain
MNHHDHHGQGAAADHDGAGTFSTDTEGLPTAVPPETVRLRDGEAFDLRILPLRKKIGDAEVRMLGYGGSIPGPTMRVEQGSEVTVNVTNETDLETTVHWHGLRLENRYDGVPEETQAPIPPGGTFTYKLRFPDPGLYWYHPHMREDYAQEMGLYAPIVVQPSDPSYWPAADRELTVTLDDVLIEDGQMAPFGRSGPNFVAMGRFGNVMLVNGETDFSSEAAVGEVVRLYVVNTANTRIFNFAVRGARMKLVGGDSGRHEHETFVEEVLISPSERAIVDVLFDAPGEARLEHRTPDHTYNLGSFSVAGTDTGAAAGGAAATFEELRTDPELAAERRSIGQDLDREPDRMLSFVAEMPLLYGGEIQASSYACPMHPDVVSSEPETCPKCGMRLAPVAAEVALPTAYACPMHPEVTASEQGACPKCGMRLIPVQAEATTPSSYVCPMHPEVTAPEPSTCPKCGMRLVASDALPASSASHEGHAHGGHEHDHGEHEHEDHNGHDEGGHTHGDHGDGLEWEDLMPEINRASDTTNMFWKLIDRETGAENHAIRWKFAQGDKVKIRLVNEMDSDHPMHHPFHVHGAGRFLVLSRDGEPEPNFVWKDTVLLRAGETVDILLHATNPGLWMAHCHIAEHTEAGMMFSFEVAPSKERR